MVLCGEEDRYTGAELASYYPATFDDLPEPELQRKSKWMGKIVRDAIRDKKGLGFDVVKCKKIWDRYDEDKSGSMDLEELNRVIKAMRKSSGDKELPFMTKEVRVRRHCFCQAEHADFVVQRPILCRAVPCCVAAICRGGRGRFRRARIPGVLRLVHKAGQHHRQHRNSVPEPRQRR